MNGMSVSNTKRAAPETIESIELKKKKTGAQEQVVIKWKPIIVADVPNLPTTYEQVQWVTDKEKDALLTSYQDATFIDSTNVHIGEYIPWICSQKRNAPQELPGPVKFSPRYPLTTVMNLDAWKCIFEQCHPSFLLKARTISKDFRYVLDYDKVWEAARLNTYGKECPPPPPGLTEWQYADLLTDIGCQAKGCTDKRARKVYWIAQRRWCETCWKQRTLSNDAISTFELVYPRLTDCIMHFTYDRSQRHQFVGCQTNAPSWVQHPRFELGYEKRAMLEMMKRIDSIDDWEEEEQDEWYEKQQTARDVLMETCQAIEAFCEVKKKEAKGAQQTVLERRAMFFERKAMEMEVPMQSTVLHLSAAYQRSIGIPREPTEKCWTWLRQKIEQDRYEAGILANIDAIVKEASDEAITAHQRKLTEEDGRIAEARKNFSPGTELHLLRQVADMVISRYLGITTETTNGVADEDLIPLILNEVYAFWHRRGQDPKVEGKPLMLYTLILDDARMIVDDFIEPIIRSWDNPDRQKTARSLRCPVCTRHKCRYTFEDLLGHIINHHTKVVGDFSSWRPTPGFVYNNLYRLKWPANLPILAEHQKPSTTWNLHMYRPYERKPTPRVVTPPSDAFLFRRVAVHEGFANAEFVINVLFAANLLQDARILDPKFKSLIAFQFAIHKYDNAVIFPHWDLTHGALLDMHCELVRAGFNDLFDDFKCKACIQEIAAQGGEIMSSRQGRFAKRGHPLGDLVHHFGTTHIGLRWIEWAFLFPSGGELAVALETDGTAAEVFERLFPQTGVLDPMLFKEEVVEVDDE